MINLKRKSRPIKTLSSFKIIFDKKICFKTTRQIILEGNETIIQLIWNDQIQSNIVLSLK